MGDFNFAVSVVKMQKRARIARLCVLSGAGNRMNEQLRLICPEMRLTPQGRSGACNPEVNEREYNSDVETEPTRKSFDVT
jgi:hypothetical protein